MLAPLAVLVICINNKVLCILFCSLPLVTNCSTFTFDRGQYLCMSIVPFLDTDVFRASTPRGKILLNKFGISAQLQSPLESR